MKFWNIFLFLFGFTHSILIASANYETAIIYQTEENLLNFEGVQIIERYPEMVFAKISPGAKEIFKAENIPFETINLNEIRMGNGKKVNTEVQDLLKSDFPNLFIVQFYAPIKKEWLEEIEKFEGIKRVQSACFPTFGLLFWIENPIALDFLDSLNFIKWIGSYLPEYKTLINFQEKEEESIKVKIRVLRETELKVITELERKIEILNISKPIHYLESPSIVVEAKGKELFEVLNIPEVFWVEDVYRAELLLSTARELHQTGVGNGCSGSLSEVPVWAGGITGAGSSPSCTSTLGTEQLVGIIDTTYNSPDLQCGSGIPNCTIFKYVNYNTSTNPACNILNTVSSCISGHYHGTGASGIILGNGAQSGGETPIQACSNKGMAFGARLWALKCDLNSADLNCLNDCWGGDFARTLRDFFLASYSDGSRISNHSWGAATMSSYTTGSEAVDIWAYDNDGDPENGLQQNYLWFFAAGNSGPSSYSIGSPASAKNDVTAAAFYNGVDGECWDCDPEPCNENKVVCYSSRGPTNDGRYGPEVAGTSQWVTAPNDGSGYIEFNGTSAASPSLAAQAALLRDWLINVRGISNPSAPLIKALLLNSGEYISSPYENLPGTAQGWGRVNLSTICDNWSSAGCNNVKSLWLEDSFYATGQKKAMDIFVTSNQKPLKCLLTWFDLPNLAGDGALINNLNLRLTAPDGTVYIGNNFTGAWSNSGVTSFDSVNNSEGVRVQTPQTGLWKLEVLSGNIVETPQPFAVTCSGQITDQTPYGIISLDRETYKCSDYANIRVSDYDLRGNGTQNVTIRSNTETNPETVTLIENPAGSGVFKGSIQLTTTPPSNGDGKLSVSHNDTITAIYIDLNDGQGNTNVQRQATATADCNSPIITNLRVEVSGRTVIISWETDELANSFVYFSPNPPNWSSSSDNKYNTTHSIKLTELASCTRYYFWVKSTDMVGNAGVDNNNGNYYNFMTGYEVYLLNENFSGGIPSNWTVIDGGSIGKSWTTANECNRYGVPPISSPFAIADSDCYGKLWAMDEQLITPPLQIPEDVNVKLVFDHMFLRYTSEIADVDIRSSLTGGEWVNILRYRFKSSPRPEHKEIDITQYAAGAQNVQVRFYYYNARADYWWIVDNVKIVLSDECVTSAGTIKLYENIYGCNSNTIKIKIRDADLQGSAIATLTTTGGDQETVICYETNPGVFVGTIQTRPLPRSQGNGYLEGGHNEQITATYYDENDGSGNSRLVQAKALIDCQGPFISNIQVINIEGSRATVRWKTNEVSNSRVLYGTSIPPQENKDDLINFVLDHSILLTGLQNCTDYYFSITSCDPYANCTSDNNLGQYHRFKTIGEAELIFNSTDVPKTIPNYSMVTSKINVSLNKTISRVKVKIGNLAHTNDADLEIFLIAPDGTRVKLTADNGGDGDNYVNTLFDEEALISIKQGTPPFTGTFRPEGDLSVLKGKKSAGEWQLEITDDNDNWIGGTLNSWSLYITYLYYCGPEPFFEQATFSDTCSGAGQGANNGIVDPGEDVTMVISLTNLGSIGLTNVSATISTNNPKVTITDNFATFPNIPAGETRQSNPNHYSFKISTNFQCGEKIDFGIRINSNEGSWDRTFQISVGNTPPGQIKNLIQENFSSVILPNLPYAWRYQVFSGNRWRTTNSRYCSQPIGLNYEYDTWEAADSWVYTPAIYLKAGTKYNLSFNVKSWFEGIPESLEVKLGSAPDSSYQSITLWEDPDINNTVRCDTQSIDFEVSASARYYLGFHCFSKQDTFFLIVDDISLTYQEEAICSMNICTTGPNIVYYSSTNPTPISEDGDGVMEAGEKWQMTVTVKNVGGANATNVFGSLSGEGLLVCNNPGNFGNISVNGYGSYTFQFVIDPNSWYENYPCTFEIGFDLINKRSDSGLYTYQNDLNFRKVQIGRPSQTQIIFTDDFANLNNWIPNPSNGASIQSEAHCSPHSNSFARINGAGASITHYHSTVGYSNIVVSFDAKTISYSLGDALNIEYYDGNTWNVAASGGPSSWVCNYDLQLPATVSNNPNFGIRFRNVSSQTKKYAYIDYVVIRGDTPPNCGRWNASCPYVSPKPIPDGRFSTTPMTVRKANLEGTQLIVDWDNRCTTDNVNIIYGPISGLSSYQLSGSKCDIQNPDLWNIGQTTNIWFLLVSDNGMGTESSWGLSSYGQRNGNIASRQCGNNQRDNSETCP